MNSHLGTALVWIMFAVGFLVYGAVTGDYNEIACWGCIILSGIWTATGDRK